MKRLLFAASILGIALLAVQSQVITMSPPLSESPGGYTVIAAEIPDYETGMQSCKTVIRLNTKTGRAYYANMAKIGNQPVLMWKIIHDPDSYVEAINNKAEHEALLKRSVPVPPDM